MRYKQPDQPTSAAPSDHQPMGSVIGLGGFIGALLRFFRRFQLPAIALGKRHLYRVMVQGSGFELPLKTSGPDQSNPIGFFATRYVAARSRLEAESLAKAHILREWQGLSLLAEFTGTSEPIMVVDDSEAIDGWFRSSKGAGFAFYCSEARTDTSVQ